MKCKNINNNKKKKKKIIFIVNILIAFEHVQKLNSCICTFWSACPNAFGLWNRSEATKTKYIQNKNKRNKRKTVHSVPFFCFLIFSYQIVVCVFNDFCRFDSCYGAECTCMSGVLMFSPRANAFDFIFGFFYYFFVSM